MKGKFSPGAPASPRKRHKDGPAARCSTLPKGETQRRARRRLGLRRRPILRAEPASDRPWESPRHAAPCQPTVRNGGGMLERTTPHFHLEQAWSDWLPLSAGRQHRHSLPLDRDGKLSVPRFGVRLSRVGARHVFPLHRRIPRGEFRRSCTAARLSLYRFYGRRRAWSATWSSK